MRPAQGQAPHVTWVPARTTFSMVENTRHQSARCILRVAIALGLAGLCAAGPASGESCAPWPGEPDPLPTSDAADPLLARWATLRAAELEFRARSLEASAPLEAHRLWRRLSCFQIQAGEATPEIRAALERTRPVRVHRLAVVRKKVVAKAGDPWADLARPVSVWAASKPRRKAPDRSAERVADVDVWLDRTEELVYDARFDAGLAAAAEARRRLGQLRWSEELKARWVRLEVLEATVHVARRREAEARACATRALAADPLLVLDASRTSPKVLELFEAVTAKVAGR